MVAHVPQNVIYLMKVLKNITISEKNDSINKKNFEYAVDSADKGWLNNLENGEFTKVTENGENFSGGQRQRIGIARALYRRPKILILDESTSALDKDTEAKILKALKIIDTKITIIIVSHNIEALSLCDEVYTLKNHKLYKNI